MEKVTHDRISMGPGQLARLPAAETPSLPVEEEEKEENVIRSQNLKGGDEEDGDVQEFPVDRIMGYDAKVV